MLHALANRFSRVIPISLRMTRHSSHDKSYDEIHDELLNGLKKNDIDGWMVRKLFDDSLAMDMIPSPEIVIEGLKACRRVNDIALAIRWMEGVKNRCIDLGTYCYILENVTPTLNELGIPTPEELGYDKPELALVSVFDM